MDEKVLALLEKAGIFSTFDKNFFAKPEIILMKNFRFWLPNCFNFEDRKDKELQFSNFDRKLQNFFRRYFDAWAKHMREIKKIDWEKYSFAMADFFLSLDARKIFDNLKSGEETAEITVSVTDALFQFRRFGDILAFDISRIRDKKEDHVAGRKAIESLCRVDDTNNNQGIYELIQGVKFSMSLPHERVPSSNARQFDFHLIWEMLRISLPYADLVNSDPTSSLVEKYIDMDRRGMFIGKYLGFNIYAKLVHRDAKGKEDISSEDFSYGDRARTWRKGNVQKKSDQNYVFREGDDLTLVISLESSLPTGLFEEIPTTSMFHAEQFYLARTGSIFLAGLCSSKLHAFQKNYFKLNTSK